MSVTLTPCSTLKAKDIQRLEGTSLSTAERCLRYLKEMHSITAVRIQHLADYWMLNPDVIIKSLTS